MRWRRSIANCQGRTLWEGYRARLGLFGAAPCTQPEQLTECMESITELVAVKEILWLEKMRCISDHRKSWQPCSTSWPCVEAQKPTHNARWTLRANQKSFIHVMESHSHCLQQQMILAWLHTQHWSVDLSPLCGSFETPSMWAVHIRDVGASFSRSFHFAWSLPDKNI